MTLVNKLLVTLLLALIGLVAVVPFTAKSQAPQVQVIANVSVELNELSASQVRRIFSMRQTSWPDEQAIVVYVLDNRDEVHQMFAKQVLGMFPYQLERMWNKLAFSGLGEKPNRVKNEQEMLEKIRQRPGAVGYVMFSSIDESVKPIKMEAK